MVCGSLDACNARAAVNKDQIEMLVGISVNLSGIAVKRKPRPSSVKRARTRLIEECHTLRTR